MFVWELHFEINMYFRSSFMKFFFLIFFSVLLASSDPAVAQAGYEDVLYLKNGSIVHGRITRQIEDSISIQTKDGNKFVYTMDQLLKITKEEMFVPPPPPPPPKKQIRPEKKSGFMHMSEWLISISYVFTESYYDAYQNDFNNGTHIDEINNNISLGYQSINGYQFNPWFILGGGVGLHLYNHLLLAPVFLDLQINFSNSRLIPFADVEAGWSFAVHNLPNWHSNYKDDGGFLGTVAFGLKYFMTPRSALNLSVGFHYQEIGIRDDYSNADGYNPASSTKSTNRIVLRTGFSF